MKKPHEKAEDVDELKQPKHYIFSKKNMILLVTVSFLAGIAWLALVRFFVVRSEETHYHANFAVYINGEREDFAETNYYEEIAACSAEYKNNPKGRVHMHEQVNNVIHVHDARVTYGNFFQNIGWNVGDEVLETNRQVYSTNKTSKLTYILNGEEVDRIDNRLIGNEDRLLVSYGELPDAVLVDQFNSVEDTAAEVNKKQDPASCSGLNGAGYNSFTERLKRATFWD